MNPHLQAAMMWGFALLAVYALWRDRRRHRSNAPLMVGAAALAILEGTLYLSYDSRVESLAYVLLTIAALLNWVVFLGAFNRKIRDKAEALDLLNRTLQRKARKRVMSGKSVSVSVYLGGRRLI